MTDHRADKIYIAGHKGMVGSSIFRELSKIKELNILTTNRNRLDLTDQSQVRKFFKKEKNLN